MRIQIISDLHLEFGPLELPASEADVLIAAGDIAIGKEGHKWLQRVPRTVVYVAGNHEYWGHDLTTLKDALTQMSRRGNVHFLENRSVEIDGVRFIGCTLWTDFHDADPVIMAEMFMVMNDFRYIAHGSRRARPRDLVEINLESRRWLEQELSVRYVGKTVVVTHHAPLIRSWYARRDEDMTRFAYCNALDELMNQRQIDLWVHGHIHESHDYVAYGVRVVCNPRGYYNYREVQDFDPTKVVSL
ncbi:MAG TPA: metallophosphoesterase [Gammaproteobacteria bacterium]|nr:metallophosphoesterase [Gammaproteobacteria bacterium]